LSEQPTDTDGPRRHRLILACWTLGNLTAAIVVAIGSQGPPAERTVDAPAADFSSRRAFQHVQMIASQPRPAGSPEIGQVRQYLERTIDSMGLMRTTQTARMSRSDGVDVEIANVAARIRGSGPTGKKAVLLLAHYDSVPNAPGACDDGSGTATLLETVRALKAGPLPKRDIIALFTDGEEIGLIGAKMFVGQARGGFGDGHPWMPNVGLVLNIEAAGNSGPCWLFETSERNGWLIREYARADPVPIGNSLSAVLYKLTRSTTDMSSFLAADVPGLNFLFFEGKECYHTPLDNLSNLDGRSLQHQGLHALTLSRHFANLDQDDPREPDVVYFNPVGRWLVFYPGSWVKPLAIGAAMLYVGVLFLEWRSRRVKVGGLAVGFVAFPIALALGTLAAQGVWLLVQHARAGAEGEAIGEPVAALLFGTGLIVFIAFYALLINRVAVCGLHLGALGWWTILTVASAWALPEGTFATLWPLVFRLTTTSLARRITWPPGSILLEDLGTLPAITIIGAGAYAMFTSVGPSTIVVSVAAALFFAGAIHTQLYRLFDWRRTSARLT
jgi:hypothetical protein